MLFKALHDSSKRGELILIDNGMCHWHLRKDGQITIREILVLPEKQNSGIGTRMLAYLKNIKGATSIFAKCPEDLPANDWYEAKGFEMVGIETTSSGRKVKHWRLKL